jgi:hypothetical protein
MSRIHWAAVSIRCTLGRGQAAAVVITAPGSSPVGRVVSEAGGGCGSPGETVAQPGERGGQAGGLADDVVAGLHFELRETPPYAAEELPSREFAAVLLQALGYTTAEATEQVGARADSVRRYRSDALQEAGRLAHLRPLVTMHRPRPRPGLEYACPIGQHQVDGLHNNHEVSREHQTWVVVLPMTQVPGSSGSGLVNSARTPLWNSLREMTPSLSVSRWSNATSETSVPSSEAW